MPRAKISDREYAVYKGDDFQFIDTGKNCAERLGIKLTSLVWMTTPAYKRRTEQNEDSNSLIVLDFERMDDDGED